MAHKHIVDPSLQAPERWALTKLADLGTKAVRKGVKPGTHPIHLVLRVRGTLGVGEDYVQSVNPAIPWRDLFLAALSQMTPQHRAVFVRDYLRVTSEGEGPAKINRDALAAEVEEMARQIVGTSERVCAGKTRASLAVERVAGVGAFDKGALALGVA